VNVDQLGKDAGARLRERTRVDTDIEDALTTLHRMRRRNRNRLAASAAAAAGIAAAATATVALWPAGPEAPARPPASQTACSDISAVTCPQPRQVRVTGLVPYQIEAPRGFSPTPGTGTAPAYVDIYQRHAQAGVTVIEAARGVDAPDSDARGLAGWISSRPFLRSSRPSEQEVSGRPAWRVDVALRAAPSGEREYCNGGHSPCRALLTSTSQPDGWEVGPRLGMLSRFYVIDAPSDRIVVVWSWALSGDQADLDRNEAVVRAMAFR
jgi:hypothetical protein